MTNPDSILKSKETTLPTKFHIVKATFFLFFFQAFLFYFIFKLYIIVLVLPNIKMNPPQVYMASALAQSYVFSSSHVRMWNWTIRKAEHQGTDAFELWCWRRLLRVPWTARRPNQSILKEINPEYSSEGLMLKLKLQHFGHLMRKADSLENAGKD